MKKILATILSVCLMLSLFAACKDKEGDADNTPTPKTTATATAKATAGSTATAAATATSSATAKPESTPAADPEVDAMLFRFWTEDAYAWENIKNVLDTGIEDFAIKINVDFEYEEGAGIKIMAQTGDPYFLIFPSSDTGKTFSLKDYPILKIRMKNETPATSSQFFLARNGKNNVTGDDELSFDISANDTEYKEYIVNLQETKGEEYIGAGDVSALRIDAVDLYGVKDPTPEDAFKDSEPYTVYIDYFGFFKTVEDAQAWNPGHIAAK